MNEWQINGIEEALAEADSPDAEWVSHEDVLKGREARLADKMVLPKAIRDLHHWGPGTELLVMDTEEGVVIKPPKPFAATTFESPEISTPYKGSPLSLEEMDRALAVEAGN